MTPSSPLSSVQVNVLVGEGRNPSLSNFALLLGSFPTALGVASYASEYGVGRVDRPSNQFLYFFLKEKSPVLLFRLLLTQVCTDLISASIVIGTISSAPMMWDPNSAMSLYRVLFGVKFTF